MRQDNLLCWRHKSFVVTIDSRHSLPLYPNLAREITPSAVNQLWVADITYLRLSRRSGCVPAWPYAPLNYFQSGSHQPRRAILLQRTATTPLTDCLTVGVHFTPLPKPHLPNSTQLTRPNPRYLSLILVPVSEAFAEFHPPLGLDLYRPIPEDNPLTSDKVKLGRKLFGDKILSRNRKLAARAAISRRKPLRMAAPKPSASTDGRGTAASPRWSTAPTDRRSSGTAAPQLLKSRLSSPSKAKAR